MQIVHRKIRLNSKNLPFQLLFIMLGLLHRFNSQINERNSKSSMGHAHNPFKLEYYFITLTTNMIGLNTMFIMPIDEDFMINTLEIRF